ncbi:MAG: type II toxin-antitoxin system RelE/ParE family toxin [Bradyrhizobium sp.]|uniref:type II toxin-antitoxin system RelE/ParE family toxin n=1 Tax=Bradyrhizobium sp. TaxID=376 RepID=UPI001E1151A5|nr:type II toxin-antitoxin system RelE/ParE family toxin [Bradyrhizobium sp.]MBV9561326.1 type II toxin-antitoxin system RelE/ParE family toxin [Bradyrhizobium sp.]
MYTVERTEEFKTWLDGLADDRAFAKITARLLRLAAGNPGDVKPVGDGISEMRVDYGPGYRIYYKRTGKTLLLILCGGDKATQEKDINRAKELAAQL